MIYAWFLGRDVYEDQNYGRINVRKWQYIWHKVIHTWFILINYWFIKFEVPSALLRPESRFLSSLLPTRRGRIGRPMSGMPCRFFQGRARQRGKMWMPFCRKHWKAAFEWRCLKWDGPMMSGFKTFDSTRIKDSDRNHKYSYVSHEALVLQWKRWFCI